MALTSIIRRAALDEADFLSALGVRSKAVWLYSDEAMATFREELTISPVQIEQGVVFVLAVGDELVGYYTLQSIEADVVELQHLFVEPVHLKHGYGSALLGHAIAEARTSGYRLLVIQSDPNAAGFYKKHGIPLIKEIPSSVPGRSIPYFEYPL